MRNGLKALNALFVLVVVALFVVAMSGNLKTDSLRDVRALPTIGMLPAMATMFALYAVVRLIQAVIVFEVKPDEPVTKKVWMAVTSGVAILGIVYFWLGVLKSANRATDFLN